jgi:hypothetical protein
MIQICSHCLIKSQSQSHVTTVSQSVCLGVKFTLGLVTRYYILSESCCVVSVGHPLWREVVSPVSHCQQFLVHCQRFNIIYIVHVTCFMYRRQANFLFWIWNAIWKRKLACRTLYMQYILGLCQHRLSIAGRVKTSVAYATTADDRFARFYKQNWNHNKQSLVRVITPQVPIKIKHLYFWTLHLWYRIGMLESIK